MHPGATNPCDNVHPRSGTHLGCSYQSQILPNNSHPYLKDNLKNRSRVQSDFDIHANDVTDSRVVSTQSMIRKSQQ